VEMYIRVLKNRLVVTVVKSIFADGKAISPLIIMPSKNIIMSWFSKQITRAEVVLVLLFDYINKGSCI
jgi:hypothetical protein